MANPILKIKRGSGTPGSLQVGEVAFDTQNKSLFIGTSEGVLPIGGEHVFAKKTFVNDAVSAEVSRATAAENALGTRIDNVLSNVDGTALNSLAEIVTAFQQADSDLNGAITTLASSASTGLSNEVTRATAAESALGTRIDGVVSAATSLTSRVSAAESDITALESDLSGRISSLETTASALGTMSTQNATNVAITGGTVANVTFTNATFTDLVIDGGTF